MNSTNTKTYSNGLLGWVSVFAIASTWEVISRLRLVDPIFFPPPSRILVDLFYSLGAGEMSVAVAITMSRCLGGYAIASLAGIVIGTVMGRSAKIYVLLDPLVEILRPIPSAAIIPVAILFLGIEERMKVAVIIFGSIWPILLNTIHGIQTVDPLLIDTGKTFSLAKRSLLTKIVLPAALPSIATGLRISLAISLILAITVEMIAGNSGLGFLIIDYERSFRYSQMYGGIVLLGLIGFCLNYVVVRIERRYLWWSRQALPST